MVVDRQPRLVRVIAVRRRVVALDCRSAFQGRYLGDPRKESAPRQRRLNLAHRWGLRSHPSLCDGLADWVAEAGLERPAYPQMPLRGNENVQALPKTTPSPLPGGDFQKVWVPWPNPKNKF